MDQFYSDENNVIEEAHEQIMPVFMNQIYGLMVIGLSITALCAWYVAANLPVFQCIYEDPIVFYGYIIGKLAFAYVISDMIHRFSIGVAALLFLLFSVSTGLILSIIFVVYVKTTIASTFLMIASMFAVLSVYGYITRRNLGTVGQFCLMAFIGITVVTLVGIYFKNNMIMMIINYIGIAVFAALTAHDTQKLNVLGEHIPADDRAMLYQYAMLGALTIYLDFINIFIILLKILKDIISLLLRIIKEILSLIIELVTDW